MRFLIGLVPALALLAQSQTPPDARALLMRAGNSVLMADTVRLAGKETSEIELRDGGHLTVADSFELERSTGGRVRLETSGTDSPMLLVADGQYVWTYFARTQNYVKSAESITPANDAFGRLKFSRDPASVDEAKIQREESLEFDGHPVACYVISAAYGSMPFSPGASDVTRTVWVAKDGEQIMRDRWDFTASSAIGQSYKVHMTTDYTSFESGIPLPVNLFVFHAPPGSTETARALPPPNGKPIGLAELVHEVKPAYSSEARAAGLQGTVSLYVEVNSDGTPGVVHVMQGLGLGLDERAIEAVKQYRYEARSGPFGATQSMLEVDVQFRLDPPASWSVASEAYAVMVPANPKVQHVVKPVPTRYTAPAAACVNASEAVVRFTVGKDGMPSEVSASLDAAAKAVQSWQFDAATVDGDPAESQAEVVFDCQPHGMIRLSEPAPAPVYHVGGGVSAPVLLSKIEPGYSEEARQAKLQGTVMLAVEIASDGRATHIHVVRPLGQGLDEKAMEAVKRWRFKPAMNAGEAVPVEATIEVNFRLL
jgi:TonB family protein